MKDYKSYLYKNGYRASTIRTYCVAVDRLHEYLSSTHQKLSAIDTDVLYRFKEYLEEVGYKTQGAINHTKSLSHYFRFLKWEPNPALLVEFAKRKKALPKGIMDSSEMEVIYMSITARTPVQKRDIAMFGLVVFQGLTRNELQVLELEDINVETHTIRIPATQKTNSRIIPLDKRQVDDLFHYVFDVRDELLLTSEKKESPYIFFSQGQSDDLHNALARFTSKMKMQHSSFTSLTNIRQSRISHWVITEDLPKAQYYSGIKYLSSLMRYHHHDIEALKKKMRVFHPWEGFN